MKPLTTRPLTMPALAPSPAAGATPAAASSSVTAAPRFVLKAPAPDATPVATPAAAAADAEASTPEAALPVQDPAQLLACLAQMSGQVPAALPVGSDTGTKPAALSRALPSTLAGTAPAARPDALPLTQADTLAAIGLADALPHVDLPRIAAIASAPTSAPAVAETPLPAAVEAPAAPGPASPSNNAASGFTPVPVGLGIDTAALFNAPRSAAPAPLQLAPGAPDSWQQPLLQTLGDRLQLQIAARNGDQAVLHLAPPQLGRVEIEIRQQGGVLQVQMSASHDEVGKQLRQISEPLRQELVQRHTGEVSVQVSAGSSAGPEGRGRDGTAGQSQQDPREQAERRAPARARDEDGQASGGFAQRMARTAAPLNG